MKRSESAPNSFDLSRRDQGVLGIEQATTVDQEFLSHIAMNTSRKVRRALESSSRFERYRIERRLGAIADRAVSMLKDEMPTTDFPLVDEEGTQRLNFTDKAPPERSYNRTRFDRPGMVFEDADGVYQLVYSPTEAIALGLQPGKTQDGEPCSNMIPVMAVERRLKDRRATLQDEGGLPRDPNNPYAAKNSALEAGVGAAAMIAGHGGTGYNNIDQQLACVDGVLARIKEVLEPPEALAS